VVRKAVEFIVAEMGPPPSPFRDPAHGQPGPIARSRCFADQDHAIIYADPEPDRAAAVQDYNLQLGKRVSELLDKVGYPLCGGGIMAGNPECCQSLSGWRASFDGWIGALEPDDLLHTKIFFDFRGLLEEGELLAALRSHLFAAVQAQPRFLPLLAHSILHYEPPLSSFGSFVLEEGADGRQALDIKGVQAQVADLARLRALQYGLDAVNTRERLQRLLELGHLKAGTVTEAQSSYSTLLTLRLEHQARCRARQLPVDNLLDPEDLEPGQRDELKRAFQQIKALQASLQHEFGGPA
jgi:CBS domain-containing protein